MILSENWKPIRGYEGRYEVSNLARVRSLPRKGKKRSIFLSTSLTRTGYVHISLCKDNKKNIFSLHFLVAIAFIGDKPKGFECNHIDGNKQNNLPSNIEYVTRRQNMQHASRLKLFRPNTLKGSQSWNSKFTEEDILTIRKTYANGGITHKELAIIYKTHERYIGQIIQRKYWRHI